MTKKKEIKAVEPVWVNHTPEIGEVIAAFDDLEKFNERDFTVQSFVGRLNGGFLSCNKSDFLDLFDGRTNVKCGVYKYCAKLEIINTQEALKRLSTLAGHEVLIRD